MSKKSQLSRHLRPSELSYLTTAISREVNTSAPEPILRTEINKIANAVLNILYDRSYTITNPYRRHHIDHDEIDLIVDRAVARRKQILNREKQQEESRKKFERGKRRYETYMELGRLHRETLMNFATGRFWYTPSTDWPFMYPQPVPCGKPMETYYVPFGFQGDPKFTPDYARGIPREEPRKHMRQSQYPPFPGPRRLPKKNPPIEKVVFDVENLHIHY